VRRGFKSEAERKSLAERQALGLSGSDRLDPHALAARHGVVVWALERLRPTIPDDVDHLLVVDGSCFSAATVIRDGRAMIVFNESHAPGRCANSITHEVSHLILEHPPVSAFDAFGNRNFPKALEEEATWLAGCLLVPGEGLVTVLRSVGHDHTRAADHFGVSVQLLRWRVNATKWRPRRKGA
jgi:hypothetical protein